MLLMLKPHPLQHRADGFRHGHWWPDAYTMADTAVANMVESSQPLLSGALEQVGFRRRLVCIVVCQGQLFGQAFAGCGGFAGCVGCAGCCRASLGPSRPHLGPPGLPCGLA
eukprot:9120422-Lingulodinium_polyedra.AAC.1